MKKWKDWYPKRTRSLERLGFPDYPSYLKSGLWSSIRWQVMERCNRICEVCGVAPATQVHHRSYSMSAMLGKNLNYLVGCCADCHKHAEFDKNGKTKQTKANGRMRMSAKKAGLRLPGVCAKCNNTAPRDGDLCAKCVRWEEEKAARKLARKYHKENGQDA